MKDLLILSLAIFSIILVHPISLISYSGGNGSVSNPYQIDNPADLQQIMDNDGDWDKHFILTDDIDCTSLTTPNAIGTITTTNVEIPFTGTFDGDNHTIRNLTINNPSNDFVGLFALISDAKIKDLKIEQSEFTGLVAAPIVIAENSEITNVHANCRISCFLYGSGLFSLAEGCIIRSCSSDGQVTTNLYSGGFITECGDCIIRHCHSDVNSYTSGLSGGFIGEGYDSYIEYCYSTGDVIADHEEIAGFIEYCYNSKIKRCYSTSFISADHFCGGFADLVENSIISECYYSGNIDAISYIGGFIVEISSDGGTSSVSDCYSSGNIYSSEFTGGFVGYNYNSTIQRCYSTMKVMPGNFSGGFGSENDGGTYICNFWDTQASGHTDGFGDGFTDPGVQGKTTSQMKDPSIFQNCNWDMNNVWFKPTEDSYLKLWEVEIPTLAEWGSILFAFLLLVIGGYYIIKFS